MEDGDRERADSGETDPATYRATVRAAYDEMAGTYAEERSADGEPVIVERLAARLPDGGRVLDAGCGEGTPGLDGHGFERVGVDVSREQCRRARAAMPGRVLQGDLTRLPLVADAVDAAVALYSLIHVPRAEHHDGYREFARVLRPGGWLLVSVGAEPWRGRNEDWMDSGTAMQWDMPGVGEAREDLAGVGFDVREQYDPDDDPGGEHPMLVARLAGQTACL